MKTLIFFLFSLAVTDKFSPDRLFVGSTPCFDEMKDQLNIPAADGCEFMKWRLILTAGNKWSADVNYGISQPNTNGFKQGGVVKKLSSQYFFDQETKVYKLASNELKNPVFLKSMTASVVHFCDEKNQLLVGNDGYGYALNLKKD